jgi:hypothetical protein
MRCIRLADRSLVAISISALGTSILFWFWNRFLQSAPILRGLGLAEN